MENTTFNFFNVKSFRALAVLLLSCTGFAQTTVTYSLGNTSYYTTQTVGTSGAFQNGAELGMYSNGGGTKSVVSYRNFKTAGDNTGSIRALQVGDIFSLQVYASAAFGQIGFSLNTSNDVSSYATRNANSRMYINVDGTNGSWYVNSAAGNQTLDYNVGTTYHNYLFKVYITSETTCDVELIVDGTTTKRLFNRTMNGAAGANITGFALYLADDWNGSANSNIYWKQVTEVRANTSVNLGYYLASGNFTPGKITNGLTANSTSTTSVNALNIGGDAGTTIILNQPNTYSGTTTVNAQARGELQNAQGFGNTSGVTVSNNGAISLYSPTGITYNNYPLTINGNGQNGANGALRNVGGNNTWTGNIGIAASARINADISGSLILNGAINIPAATVLTIGGTQPITINGDISGTTLSKDGTNTLTLTSSFNGFNALNILEGNVSVSNAGSISSATVGFPASASAAMLEVTNSISIPSFLSVGSTKATVDVATGQAATLTGMVYGTGRLTKSGAGTLNLFSSSTPMSGGVNIGNGILAINSGGQLGGGSVNMGLDANDIPQGNAVSLSMPSGAIISQPLIVAANTSGASRTAATGAGQTASFNGAVTLNGSLTISGNGITQFSNSVSGTGGLICNDGLIFIGGPTTYQGNTTINTGAALRLANSNVMSDVSNLVLNGGEFQTSGYNEAMNLLALESSSTISFNGGGSHVISFANSSEEPWTGTLTITGWNGTAGQSNTTGGRIIVGVGGLTSAQLQQIVFQGYSGTPVILPSGELVPPGPSLAVTAGSANHGDSCVGTAAATITYTITNTGGDAAGVSVVSNNAEFVVSNLSSTTIGNNATATYDVTFTPSAAGSRTADITITSTPSGNTPIIASVNGNGLANVTYYADSDNDSYGDPSDSQASCTGAPEGFTLDNTDCDDGNNTVHPGATEICDGLDNDCDGLTDGDDPSLTGAPVFYADADNDGYGDNGNAIQACSPQPGYVADNTDCDDTKNTVHPGAAEIGYNLIDDDCDGLVDEGFPPKNTVIQGAQCNTVLAAIDTQLVANLVAGAQGYRWRITTMNGPAAGQIQFLDTALRVMKINQLANYAFDTQYKVEVAVLYAGFWQPYAASNCTVTTPAATTSLAVCGQTLTGMSNVVYANAVPFSTGYRFRVSDPLSGANMQIIDRQVREFRMNLITDFFVQYGKQYNVEVAIRNTDGSYLPYGNICSVTTPVFPTTSLQDSQCDDYAVPDKNTAIYAVSYPGAIAYVFQVSGPGLPVPVEVTKTLRTFKLNDFPMLLPGATYNVRVRLVFNNADPAGPYGKICTIVTPGLARQMARKFDAIAYPNPFADHFNIGLQTASGNDVTVKIYDMLGRLLETMSVKPDKESSVGAGENYPSGVYNVIISQGEETKALRVVKR